MLATIDTKDQVSRCRGDIDALRRDEKTASDLRDLNHPRRRLTVQDQFDLDSGGMRALTCYR